MKDDLRVVHDYRLSPSELQTTVPRVGEQRILKLFLQTANIIIIIMSLFQTKVHVYAYNISST